LLPQPRVPYTGAGVYTGATTACRAAALWTKPKYGSEPDVCSLRSGLRSYTRNWPGVRSYAPEMFVAPSLWNRIRAYRGPGSIRTNYLCSAFAPARRRSDPFASSCSLHVSRRTSRVPASLRGRLTPQAGRFDGVTALLLLPARGLVALLADVAMTGMHAVARTLPNAGLSWVAR